MTTLQTKRAELAALQKKYAEWIKEAGGADAMNLAQIKEFGGDTQKALDALRKLNEAMDALGKECKNLADLEAQAKAAELAQSQRADQAAGATPGRREPVGPPVPTGKTLGQIIVESKGWQNAEEQGLKLNHKFAIDGFDPRNLKAVFQRAGVADSGFAPESLRIPGLIVDAPFQEPMVIDIVPGGTTSQAAVKYMRQTRRGAVHGTPDAAPRAEGAALAEAQFEYEEQSETVQSIGAILPVTEEQLEDVPFIESLLSTTMLVEVRRRVSLQALLGDNTGSNLNGLNATVTRTHARGGDNPMDAFYKAMVRNVMTVGYAQTNGIIINPLDWEEIRLWTDNQGNYIFGNPSEAGFMTLWGIPRVLTTEMTQGTSIQGDFTYCMLVTRRGMIVETGLNADDFGKLKLSIRAHTRVAMVTLRPEAFVKVTGL